MRKAIIIILVVLGAFFGIVWWFDVEQTGGSFSDFFSDPVGGTQSLFSRFTYWISGVVENIKSAVGIQADPVAIAAGMIAGFESFSPTAYPDPPGQTVKYSIGYGHEIVDGDGLTTTSTISEDQAEQLLQDDLQTVVSCVNSAVTAPVTPQQQAALYSLTYNIGCGAFQSSTLLSLLNNGDYEGAQAQFAVWNEAGGQVDQNLVSRRASEADVFGSEGPAGAIQATNVTDEGSDNGS
jgi:lysozyme